MPISQIVTNSIANGAVGATQTAATNQFYGFKNRIINGAMMIDQRNAGASVTPASTNFTLDRWQAVMVQASKFSVEQTISGVTAPVGFTDYLGVTSTSSYSVLTGDTFLLRQAIEGFNTADLGWGTANASTVTLSFWTRSSLTGTFGGAFTNSAANRSYPFSYTISAANTWEYKTVTVVGDTSGTWLTNNGVGIEVRFGLGSGSTFSGTAGAWGAGNIVQPTGTVSVVGTNGATFYITGVQLEKGSTATSFDYRPYGTELALCQRYYYVGPICTYGYPSPSSGGYASIIRYDFKVTMRASATVTTTYSGQTNVSGTPGAVNRTTDFFSDQIISTGLSNVTWVLTYTASAEL
jgi:hypothetical protein